MLSIAWAASTGRSEFSLFKGSPFRRTTRFRWYSNQSSQKPRRRMQCTNTQAFITVMENSTFTHLVIELRLASMTLFVIAQSRLGSSVTPLYFVNSSEPLDVGETRLTQRYWPTQSTASACQFSCSKLFSLLFPCKLDSLIGFWRRLS